MAATCDGLTGDVCPPAKPGADGADNGQAKLALLRAFPVNNLSQFKLTQIVEQYGRDKSVTILLSTEMDNPLRVRVTTEARFNA